MLKSVPGILQTIPIFSGLDSDSLKKVAPLFREKTYKEGEILFREASYGDRLYIIVDGEVAIRKREETGDESTELALRRKGDIFGEMSLLDEEPRFATARATQPTSVLELSKSGFVTMLKDHPLIAYQIMRTLSSRLRQSDLHMVDQLRRKSKELQEAYQNLKAYAQALTDSNRELNRAKGFLERIVATSPFSIISTDTHGNITLFNRTAEREYGYLSVEVFGRNVEMLRGHANSLNLTEQIRGALQESRMWRGEIIASRKDGEDFIADTVICEIQDENAVSPTLLHISRNVTDEKNLNRQALELERMATRGEMAAEVAHELNNYLQIVTGNLDLLSLEIEADPRKCLRERIPRMQSELENIGCLVNSLMDFAVPRADKEPLDMVNFIQKELFFLRPQNRFDDIVFEMNFDQDLPLIEADHGQLQQLFYNLMNNAADALRPCSDRDRKIAVTVRHLKNQEQVEITVRDNGTGIPQEKLSKLLKERFTTKEKGHGFGLLSVRRAVENHHGSIQVESQEGKGTRFIIALPLKQPDQAEEVSSSSQPEGVCRKT